MAGGIKGSLEVGKARGKGGRKNLIAEIQIVRRT